MLTPHSSWNVIDSTKLTAFAACPRKYLFNYILGWRPEGGQFDLVFGSAVHLAMDYLMSTRDGQSRTYTKEQIDTAFGLFLEEFRATYPEEMLDAVYAPKTPENFYNMLELYKATRTEDDFKTLHTEVAGRVHIDDTRSVVFKIDAIVKTSNGVEVWDHKTTRWSRALWQNTFPNSIQIGTYLHTCYCVFGSDVFQAVINGLLFRNPPKLKKNGEPYANASEGNELCRLPIAKTPQMLGDWHQTVLHYYKQLEADTLAVSEHLDMLSKEVVLKQFPRNCNACFQYNKQCPYFDYCVAWTNPLERADKYGTPQNMRVEFWNPVENEDRVKERWDV